MIFSGCYNYVYLQMRRQAENCARHMEFIDKLVKQRQAKAPESKSTKLLTKAVNPVKVKRTIRQPCWRAGRWKSLT